MNCDSECCGGSCDGIGGYDTGNGAAWTMLFWSSGCDTAGVGCENGSNDTDDETCSISGRSAWSGTFIMVGASSNTGGSTAIGCGGSSSWDERMGVVDDCCLCGGGGSCDDVTDGTGTVVAVGDDA